MHATVMEFQTMQNCIKHIERSKAITEFKIYKKIIMRGNHTLIICSLKCYNLTAWGLI